MSLSYENRAFLQDPPNYPTMQEQMQEEEYNKHEATRYPDPDISYHQHAHTQGTEITEGDVRAAMGMPELPMRELSDAPSPGRSKPVQKPDRGSPPKDANGRFLCNWLGCTEEIKDFGRKCEWSKHMDKHDRPYKCPSEGCEKLPGFTYSGGLLRHEREVHNKHGGPRKQLNCPHLNCKRHTGKGFSRQENLNEHLRRVHTDGTAVPALEESEEDGTEGKVGQKRKRAANDDNEMMKEELKRLKAENEDLRREAALQREQTSQLIIQMSQLRQGLHPQMHAPQAQMM
ncbi:C2H2 transcription factor [Phlyctema vagabunda]|uniref:C2H2 transcription factor n=1 Tax=Phlyctema vagabunda TaxID=108571 RepID=A0ABR4PGT3_9HELO